MSYETERRQIHETSGVSEKLMMLLAWIGLGFVVVILAVVFLPFLLR